MIDEDTKGDGGADDVEFIVDEEGVAPELGAKIKKLKETLQKSEAERKEYLEGWQRAKADYINFKKDEGKRFEDMARFVTTSIVEEFLPVLDSFDLALQHGIPKEVERGIILIRSQFEDVLRKRGIEEIHVKSGETFDPAKHESVGEIDAQLPSGAIADVVQKGYMFREKVMRPARVRLAK